MSDIIFSEHLRYESEDGNFYRLNKMGRWPAGSKSGSKLANGHVVISLFGRQVSARRLAWYMHYGEWPTGEVLSLNGIVDDLRIANLAMASSGNQLTQKALREYCEYIDGKLVRKIAVKGGHSAIMGSLVQSGYLETSVYGKRFLVHRLIWLYHFGTWPPLIDHINGHRTDNRIENLRAADYARNAWNTKATPCRQLPRGVDMPKNRLLENNPYRMRLRHNGRVYMEYFHTAHEAKAAYEALKRALCGDWSPL